MLLDAVHVEHAALAISPAEISIGFRGRVEILHAPREFERRRDTFRAPVQPGALQRETEDAADTDLIGRLLDKRPHRIELSPALHRIGVPAIGRGRALLREGDASDGHRRGAGQEYCRHELAHRFDPRPPI